MENHGKISVWAKKKNSSVSKIRSVLPSPNCALDPPFFRSNSETGIQKLKFKKLDRSGAEKDI